MRRNVFTYFYVMTVLSFFCTNSLYANNCEQPEEYLKQDAQRSLKPDAAETVFITHSSIHFDPARSTKVGVNHLISFAMDKGIPLFYLHDAGNPVNPFAGYMYDHCEPDAFIYSEIGHHALDLKNVRKIYVGGGYFEMCQQNTVTDSIRSMAQNPETKQITVVQVLDAVFSVAQEKEYEDSFYEPLYSLQENRTFQYGKATVSLDEITSLMSGPEVAFEYFGRRIDKMPLPSGWGVELRYLGETLNYRTGSSGKKVVFNYIRSDDL